MAQKQIVSTHRRKLAGLLLVASSWAGLATAYPLDAVRAAEGLSAAPSFELDIQPILTAAGCNSGPCHGKAKGQNGFSLSLLGFDNDYDYAALTKEGRGRRVAPAAPEASLILRKASAQTPHGGGLRLPAGSPEYVLLTQWISLGMPRSGPDAPQIERIELSPPPQTLAPGQVLQLTVAACFSDGSTRDVTRLTDFQSNETAIVHVNDEGRLQAGQIPGEAAIMARYMGNIATWNTAIPLPGDVPDQAYADLPRHNFIDDLVWDKLQQLGLFPSPPCDDAKFLRRVYLDVIGQLPTADEARAFLADASPDKRARLIDALLERLEYADYWATKWMDLLRPNPYRVGVKATYNFDAWIRGSFRRNQPYDQFVRELITAQGSTFQIGPATLFRDRREPDEIATLVSQLFLGIRLECAKCHHHPFEVWGQDDFYGFAAYFARIGHKGTGISPPISGSEEMIFSIASGSVTHPRTGAVVPPSPLFGTAREPGPDEDLRAVLADWMFADDNPFPAEVAANRIWAELMGRGLTDPVDDLRATNPASNPALQTALGAEFRRLNWDQKALLRVILNSYVYGLSSTPHERNAADYRNFSRHYRQRLSAETLWDAFNDVTGTYAEFPGTPPGSRATQVWTHRVESTFLDTFGRPDPNQDPPCERSRDSSVVQTLHLMNSPQLFSRATSDDCIAAQLAGGDLPPAAIVEELYFRVYSRPPAAEELAAILPLYAESADSRRALTEDLLWALLNTPEFLFKD